MVSVIHSGGKGVGGRAVLIPSTKALPTRWPDHTQDMAPYLATWTWSVTKTAFYCAEVCFPCVWSKGIQCPYFIEI